MPVGLTASTVAAEGHYQASKWLSQNVLFSIGELEGMLNSIPDLLLFRSSGLFEGDMLQVDRSDYLDAYSTYLTSLQRGELPDLTLARPMLQVYATIDVSSLYRIDLPDGRSMVKARNPVVQIQLHNFAYSAEDHRFHSNVFGEGSIAWGLQIGYPQIYQDPRTQSVVQIDQSERFPNTAVYRSIQRWCRHNTVPTPFKIGDHRVNVPIRLGKEVFPWINCHPQLAEHGLEVVVDER